MRVFIDVDGVLADFDTAFYDLLARLEGRPRLEGRYDPSVWAWPSEEDFSLDTIAQAWNFVNSSDDWWSKLKPVDSQPGETMSFLRDLNMLHQALPKLETYFVTARPLGNFTKRQTERWLEQTGSRQGIHHFNASVIAGCDNKGRLAREMNAALIIDDGPHIMQSVEKWSPLTRRFLYNRQHNRLFDETAVGATRIENFYNFSLSNILEGLT